MSEKNVTQQQAKPALPDLNFETSSKRRINGVSFNKSYGAAIKTHFMTDAGIEGRCTLSADAANRQIIIGKAEPGKRDFAIGFDNNGNMKISALASVWRNWLGETNTHVDAAAVSVEPGKVTIDLKAYTA